MSDLGDKYKDQDFVEREQHTPDFSGFGELPEDLLATGPIARPTGVGYIPPIESDSYQLYGGASRPFVEPIPGIFGQGFAAGEFVNIAYLPRNNFPSFRSQRFFAVGFALLPPDPTTFVPLLVEDTVVNAPGTPQTFSSGILFIPDGFGAVITGIRQFVGDSTAFQKSNGEPDDIAWRVSVGGTAVFNFGNVPCILSSPDEEAEMYVIVNEGVEIQASAKNCLDPTDPLARDIGVKVVLTGHQFPLDEIDDVFRNR